MWQISLLYKYIHTLQKFKIFISAGTVFSHRVLIIKLTRYFFVIEIVWSEKDSIKCLQNVLFLYLMNMSLGIN